jgi:predicted nucleotidyltransferase
MDRVKLHYEKAVEHYGKENVLGVFLYGSQNYGCDLETSDVDTKCILVPDLYHLAIKPYEIKHLHIPREDGESEVCECMPIQHMVANWKKQNPNFLEVLWTKYCIINQDYWYMWQEFVGSRESIAHYDMNKGLKSIAGQALHTIKENPNSGKKIGNAVRLQYLLKAYRKGVLYEDCLRPPEDVRQLVKALKAGLMNVGPDAAEELIKFFDEVTKDKTEYPIHTELDERLNNLILKTIQTRFLLD